MAAKEVAVSIPWGMNMPNKLFLLHCVFIIPLIIGTGFASADTSNNSFSISQDRLNSGGRTSANSGFLSLHSIGQPLSGHYTSSSHIMQAGFFHLLHTVAADLGDIDNDGDIDLEDVIIGLRIVIGDNAVGSVTVTADVNGDGKIGLEEILFDLEKLIATP